MTESMFQSDTSKEFFFFTNLNLQTKKPLNSNLFDCECWAICWFQDRPGKDQPSTI